MRAKNILFTGPPRCGKSTLIEAIVGRIDRPLAGFFTREMRERGQRTGFEIVSLDGQKGVLAHETIRSSIRVGKYGVNLEDLDRIAVPSMIPSRADQIVVIDEIGKMECYSPLFRETLIRALDSLNTVIGAIALKGGPFIQKVKNRPDVKLVLVSEHNRDALVDEMAAHLLSREV